MAYFFFFFFSPWRYFDTETQTVRQCHIGPSIGKQCMAQRHCARYNTLCLKQSVLGGYVRPVFFALGPTVRDLQPGFDDGAFSFAFTGRYFWLHLRCLIGLIGRLGTA